MTDSTQNTTSFRCCAVRRFVRMPAVLVSFSLALTGTLFAADPTGETIFAEKCAACHGAKGEGVAESYAKPLVGDRPLADLAKVIDETMPEGEPEVLDRAASEKVAAYVYDAFYSEAAQARNQPARIELSRLTVRQYRNAVADLVGSFTGTPNWGDERGLHGEYYNDRRTRRDRRVFERVDPTVAFDFGTDAPGPESFEADEFSIQWEGAVLAPETGDYDFVVRTEHSMRLWVNDLDTPLIDGYVKSGDGTEHRGSLFLVGGRVYPLRLEFSKANQGVDDKKKDAEPVKASISLSWKRPHQVEEVIPERCLSPKESPATFVVETPFPPDDRSMGFERGTSISREWDAATTYAAIDVANKLLPKLDRLAGTKDDASDRTEKLRAFCHRFAERAFRRPLTDEQKRLFVDAHFEGASDPSLSAKRVVLLTLKSPRFLYREIASEEFDAYDAASRLSFGLWDSLPDKPLLDAAAKGQLKTTEQVRSQAARMADDLRTRAKVREFLHQWLQLDRMHDIAKDGEQYPGFDAILASDLRTSLDLFLDDVVWSDGSDFRRLLLDDSFYANGRLAKFYGVDLPADAGFEKVSFEPASRAGVLTHPYLMSGFAYFGTSSPIHRGVFLSRSLLGRVLMPPPEAITPLTPDLHPDLTTRQRVDLQTSDADCRTCHDLVNPLGFSLEEFDAVGRFRAEEKGKPIDAGGSYLTQTGETVKFEGAREMAAFLVGSDEAHGAFVEQMFAYVTKHPIQAYGPGRIDDLRRSFTEGDFSIRNLLIETVTVSATTTGEPKEKKE